METLVAWYLFFLGLAAGLAILAMTAYSAMSPKWLRACLLISGVLLLSRYVSMLLFATAASPHQLWPLRICWFGSSIGLTFPIAVSLDQLVRHPAMTPRKLTQWYAPFLVTYLVALAAGRFELTTDPLIGSQPELIGWARILLSVAQSVFVLLVGWLSLKLILKIPAPQVRRPIGLLLAALAWLGIDGVILATGGWYVRPFLFSEMFAILAIWYAFDSARHHPL